LRDRSRVVITPASQWKLVGYFRGKSEGKGIDLKYTYLDHSSRCLLIYLHNLCQVVGSATAVGEVAVLNLELQIGAARRLL
jgi:hypothetical protein